MDLNMWNNQKVNVDCKLCFICQQQGKDKLCSTPRRIRSLSSNLFGFWWLRVLDITSSSVIFPLHDEAELENYLVENEGKYQKVCASRYESQKLQRAVDNNKSISEEDNPVEPSPSFFCSFRMKKSQWCCPVLFATKKIYQRISMLMSLIMLKGKKLMFNTTTISQKNGKK